MSNETVEDFPTWMTPTQAARYVRVRDTRIMQWIRNGSLPASNVGKANRPSYRVNRSDLDDLLRSFTVAAQVVRRRRARQAGQDFFPEISDS